MSTLIVKFTNICESLHENVVVIFQTFINLKKNEEDNLIDGEKLNTVVLNPSQPITCTTNGQGPLPQSTYKVRTETDKPLDVRRHIRR